MSKVYPVIHYYSDELSINEAILAHSFKTDGIFLISHSGHDERLGELGRKIKELLPNFKVGINLLGSSIIEAAKVAKENKLNMVWGDSCGVSSRGLDEEGEELKFWANENKEIEIFASVAFKYQKIEINPLLAAQEARKAGFIPTTSGSGTGSAPELNKIKKMSEDGKEMLAVASGMDCHNIVDFKPYLSDILVATGISKDDYRIDIDKLAKFMSLVR